MRLRNRRSRLSRENNGGRCYTDELGALVGDGNRTTPGTDTGLGKPGQPTRTRRTDTMKNTAQDQSLNAWKNKKEEGSLTGDREKVYKIVKKQGPITCQTVAHALGKRPSDISGRFTELRDHHDMIEEAGVEEGHTLWTVKEKEARDVVFPDVE